jgi:hypothetical protein
MDVLKKKILSRSIVDAVLDYADASDYQIITSEIQKEIQQLQYSEQTEMLNYLIKANNLASSHVTLNVGNSFDGLLIETSVIKICEIAPDFELLKLIIINFIDAVFKSASNDYKSSLINDCIEDKTKFEKLVASYSFDDINDYFEKDIQNNESNYNSDYDYYDYFDGYDSTG